MAQASRRRRRRVVGFLRCARRHAQEPAPAPPTVQKLGPNRLRIGEIQIDTARREVSVPGKVNDVKMLEWIANTRGGMKAYESLVTVESDAITFNAAPISHRV